MAEHSCGINKFFERDIDMLLAEELRVNADFCRWLLDRLGFVNADVPAINSNVSVVEDGSEADVVATFGRSSGGLHRLFVENKIDASLMPAQLERYERRADGEIRRGLIQSYSIMFFTPSAYLRTSLPSPVQQITFEEVADMLAVRGDTRGQYRASLLMKALPLKNSLARDTRIAVTDPYIKEWWDRVYAMLEREFPGFFVHKTRYPRSVYFAPETYEQGRYLRVDFKGHKGEVDLAFKNIPVETLRQALAMIEDVPGHLVANGKSSAIQISDLAPFVISDGFDAIESKVRPAYQAAHQLLVFWRTHRERLDSLSKTITANLQR